MTIVGTFALAAPRGAQGDHVHRLVLCLVLGSLFLAPTALASPENTEPAPESDQGIVCDLVLGPDSCSRWPIYAIEEYLGIP